MRLFNVTHRAAPWLALTLLLAVPLTATCQPVAPLNWRDKLHFQVKASYGPVAILGLAAYAGLLQETNAPREWGQGGEAYGKRLASTAGAAGIHGALAFGLGSALHQDPRYFRSGSGSFLHRTGHALRGTILTRTDSGGETFSTWRVGSAYGEAFLSNLWYPARLDNARLGFEQGSIRLGFDMAGNLGAEFWPDIKKAVFGKK